MKNLNYKISGGAESSYPKGFIYKIRSRFNKEPAFLFPFTEGVADRRSDGVVKNIGEKTPRLPLADTPLKGNEEVLVK